MRRLENQAMHVCILTKLDEQQEDNATGQLPAATKQNNKFLELVATLQNVNGQSSLLSLEKWKARQLQQQERLASSIHCPQPCILIFHTLQQSISLNIIIPADIRSQATY